MPRRTGSRDLRRSADTAGRQRRELGTSAIFLVDYPAW